MRAALSLLLPLAFVIRCVAQTPAVIQYEGLPGVALYSNGYLLSWDNPQFSQITIYGRDTQPAYSVAEHKDGIYHVAWSVDSDGVAAGVYQQVRPAWEGRIDLLDPSGKLTRTISTGSYIPEHVVFAPDHSIWMVGFDGGNDGSKGDFNVLHHYARTGEELGEALLWSQIAGDHNSYTALAPLLGGRLLFAGTDRIGFQSHTHYGHDTWTEVSFSGVLLGKYDLESYGLVSYWPIALTAGGTVYASIYQDKRFQGWALLDRVNKAWRKVAGYPKGEIIGGEGENVVFSRRDGDLTIIQLVPSGSLRVEKLPEDAAALVVKP